MKPREATANLNVNRIIENEIIKENIKYEKDRLKESRKGLALDEKALLIIENRIRSFQDENEVLKLSDREGVCSE